jgi:hypothetical protein
MPGIVRVPRELRGRRPQLGHACPPRGQHQLGVGRTVVLAERAGQVPGVQVPLGAGRARHRRDGDVSLLVPVVRQVPGQRQPPAVGPRRLGERLDVLGPGHIGQRGQLGRVLPGQLAGQGLGGGVGGHQPREPAGRGVVEVLVIVVGDTSQVGGQIGGPPFGARRRRVPGRLGELSGQFADHGDPVAVGGQDPLSPRAGYPAHLCLDRLVLLRCTVPLPAGPARQPFAKPPGETACQSCEPPTTRTPEEKQVTIAGTAS